MSLRRPASNLNLPKLQDALAERVRVPAPLEDDVDYGFMHES